MDEGSIVNSETPILITPDRLNLGQTVDQIIRLKPGDILPLSHSAMIIRCGDKTFLTDPFVGGSEPKLPFLEKGRLYPPGKGWHLRSEDKNNPPPTPQVSLFETDDLTVIAQTLAPHIDAITVSHLDPDHVYFPLIRRLMEVNPSLQVYGPLVWQKFLARTHTLESDPDPTAKPLLSETVLSRLHSLIPIRPAWKKGSLTADYPKLAEYSSSRLGEASVTAFEIRHMGSQYSEHSSAYLFENGQQHLLSISDSALSPEAVTLVDELYRQGRLTQIITSTAVYNPEPLYFIKNPELATRIREEFEEYSGHSAFLPFVLLAITEGKIPVITNHGGFFINQAADETFYPHRIPTTDSPDSDPAAWLELCRHRSLSFITSYLNHPDRKKYSDRIISWFKRHPIPKPLLDRVRFAKASQII